MRYSSVAVSVLAVACAACNAGENPSAGSTGGSEAAVHDVSTRMDEYVAAAKSGKLDVLSDFFAPDAIVWEPELKATASELVQIFDEFVRANALDSLRITAT